MNNEIQESRRRFLGQVTLSVGGIALSGLAQGSMLGTCLQPQGLGSVHFDPCGDWKLDDMCAAYPPYAFRTGAAVPHTSPVTADAGADWHWLA